MRAKAVTDTEDIVRDLALSDGSRDSMSIIRDRAIAWVAERDSLLADIERLRESAEVGGLDVHGRTLLIRKLKQFNQLMVADEERRGRGPLISEVARIQIAFLDDLARRMK